MKSKLINFFSSMGISIFSFNSINSCGGFCNSCQFNCIPGLVIVISYNYIIKRLKQRWQQRNEKY